MTQRARGLGALLLFAVVAAACLDWSKLDAGRCGDGFVGPEEGCDDGNRKSGDGCDADCRLEQGCEDPGDGGKAMCDAGGAVPSDGGCDGPCPGGNELLCGNSNVDEGEECDDGSARAGDGCDQLCQFEPERPLCGNGTLDEGEVCDDRNQSNADGCLNGCSRATCGDGQVRAYVEECEVVLGDDSSTCNGCVRCPVEPDGYFNPRTGHCYTRHAERVSQGAARRICQAEGGDLWTVTSHDEAMRAVTHLMLSGTQWLGRLKTSGGEAWVSGESITFSNYSDGEPRLPNGPCIALRADGAGNPWRSETCASELRFVCERGGASISLPSNRAYKVRTAEVMADEARALCVAEGGRLVALETPDEQAYVAGIANLPVWVDAGDGCVTLEPSDQLLDRVCSERAAFICEFE